MSKSPTANQLPPPGPSNVIQRGPCIHIGPRMSWVKVECPTCGKFVCKATPGSTVQVVCGRCKTESVTAVAA